MKKQINSIGGGDLFNLLTSIKGHPFEGIVLFTKVVLMGGKKTEALFNGGVFKLAKYVFCANREYNRALEIICGKMGIDFANWTPQAHNYANIKMGGNVICHDSDALLPMEEKRLYAQFMFHEGCTIETFYFNAEMQPLTYDQVKPYLPNKESKKQADLGLSKENQLRIINPSLKSIRQVSINGMIYEVTEN